MQISNSGPRAPLRLSLGGTEHKSYLELLAVTIIALAFPLISISIHFIGRLHDFFRDYHMLLLGEYITNFVFLYVCGLLWFTHRRWVAAEKERKELEDIVSGISPDALVVMDRNGAVIACNDSMERMFGYRPQEVFSRSVDLLYSESQPQMKHWRQVHEALEKDGFHIGAAIGKRKDGTLIPLEVITGTVSSNKKAVLLFRDMTEREKAEGAIRTAYAELNQIFETAGDGMCVLGLDLKAVRVNKTLLDLLGLSPEEARDKYCYELFRCKHHNTPACSLYRIKNGENRFESEMEIERKDGTRFPCLFTVAPFINGSGNLAGIIEGVKDITERKAMEDRLRALAVIDELTGLYNRRGFLAFSEQQVRFSERTRKGFTLFFADLDDLKRINDLFGHTEGDRALQTVASIFKETFRKPDIVSRIGGDEFAIIAVEAEQRGRNVILDRLHARLDRFNQKEEAKYRLSVSIGWAYYNPEQPCAVRDLMEVADNSMYREKQAKRNQSRLTENVKA